MLRTLRDAAKNRRRLLIRASIVVLCVSLAAVAGVAYGRIIPRLSRRLSGHALAASSFAVELHKRDFEHSPQMLHVLLASDRTMQHHPLRGVRVHSLPLDPTYQDRHDYCFAVRMVSLKYNLITLAQVCRLVMDGEDSARVRYVLRLMDEEWPKSYGSNLLRQLSLLRQGDSQARAFFERIYRIETEARAEPVQRYAEAVMSRASNWAAESTGNRKRMP